jgi:hypothetical protein
VLTVVRAVFCSLDAHRWVYGMNFGSEIEMKA